MEIILAILGVILIPLLIGILFGLIVGGPIYLLMKSYEMLMFYGLNPIIAKIREIPVIGKLLCFIITLCIGLPLIGIVIGCICIPVVCIIAYSITGGNI